MRVTCTMMISRAAADMFPFYNFIIIFGGVVPKAHLRAHESEQFGYASKLCYCYKLYAFFVDNDITKI